MAHPEPSQIIDRDSEVAVFSDMLRDESARRVLVVYDGPGRGKTDLLRKLQYKCEKDVPTARYSFANQSVPQILDVLEQMARQLEVGPQTITLDRFDELLDARALENTGEFVEAWTSMRGSIDLTSASLSGEAQAAGVIQNIHIQHAENFTTYPAWTTRIERHAERLCIEAFFSDVLKAAATRSIVLLFDSVDLADEEIRRWMLYDLVAKRVLSSWENHRLIVVVAGNRAHEILRPLIDLHPERIEPAPTLNGWEVEDVRSFLELHDCRGLSEEQVDVIQRVIALGSSLVKALEHARLLLDPF